MIKQQIPSLLITAMLLIPLHIGLTHAEVVTDVSCEEKLKHHKQSLIELEDELSQVNTELEEERELRKELQEQLKALTELEENINERETLDSTNNH